MISELIIMLISFSKGMAIECLLLAIIARLFFTSSTTIFFAFPHFAAFFKYKKIQIQK